MKRLLILFFIGMGMISAYAQNNKTILLQPPRPKVGVVLGGGGAKGAAHIGVLKYLEELGIPVDYVAGTSMGSIIGGLYAMGYSPDELAVLIADMDWSQYVGNSIDRSVMSPEMRQRYSTMALNIPFNTNRLLNTNSRSLTQSLPNAYVNNTSLINLFNDLCIGYQQDMDFNNLPIPFACVATDIATGKEVDIRYGSVPTAMRASMAIPGVFSPVMIDGKVLVDGGLANNFPVDLVQEMGADIIIGVEVSDPKPDAFEEIPSLPTVLDCLVSNAVSSKREANRKLCTVYMTPDITGYGTLSFTPDAIDTLVNRGYKKAMEYSEQLQRIKQFVNDNALHPISKQLHAPKARNLKASPVYINAITINQNDMTQIKWLARRGGLQPGREASFDDIDHAVSVFRGTGAFNDITYNIIESDVQPDDTTKAYDLIFNFKSTQPHVIGLGSHYDSEEGAALLIGLGINEKRLSGFKFNLTGRLSYNPRLNATATYALIPVANLNAAYDYRSQHFKVLVNNNTNTNLHIVQNRFSAYVSQFQLHNFEASAGISYTATTFDQAYYDNGVTNTTAFADHNPALDANRLFGPFVHINYDNLDHAYFARHGINARLDAQLHLDPNQSQGAVQDLGLSFIGHITPGNGKVTIIPQLYGRIVFGDALYANLWNIIGGEVAGRHIDQQMPFIGVSHVNETSNLTSILRCDVRYNFFGKHYVTAMYNLLFGYDFNLRNWNDASIHYSGFGLRYAYSSPIGPVSMTAQWSDCTRQFSLYFSLGYNF